MERVSARNQRGTGTRLPNIKQTVQLGPADTSDCSKKTPYTRWRGAVSRLAIHGSIPRQTLACWVSAFGVYHRNCRLPDPRGHCIQAVHPRRDCRQRSCRHASPRPDSTSYNPPRGSLLQNGQSHVRARLIGGGGGFGPQRRIRLPYKCTVGT